MSESKLTLTGRTCPVCNLSIGFMELINGEEYFYPVKGDYMLKCFECKMFCHTHCSAPWKIVKENEKCILAYKCLKCIKSSIGTCHCHVCNNENNQID